MKTSENVVKDTTNVDFKEISQVNLRYVNPYQQAKSELREKGKEQTSSIFAACNFLRKRAPQVHNVLRTATKKNFNADIANEIFSNASFVLMFIHFNEFDLKNSFLKTWTHSKIERAFYVAIGQAEPLKVTDKQIESMQKFVVNNPEFVDYVRKTRIEILKYFNSWKTENKDRTELISLYANTKNAKFPQKEFFPVASAHKENTLNMFYIEQTEPKTTKAKAE